VTGSTSVTAGSTTQLTATATMSDGTMQVVTNQATWTSASTSVATVNTTGLVTGVVPGSAQITASYQSRTAQRSITVGPRSYSISVRAEAVTAVATCDDIIQGSGTGEFATSVRAFPTGGSTQTISQTTAYPGNPDSLITHKLQRNASLTLSGSRTFSVVGAPGNTVRVEFRATEWDEQIVIFPPSIRWVRDGDMNDRSDSITHTFGASSFSGLGNRSITLGGSGCQIRLNYSITATPQ